MFEVHHPGDEMKVIQCILRGRPNMICINDDIEDDDDFDAIVSRVNGAFQKRFPDKCEFEL